jgi:hypothetical protein
MGTTRMRALASLAAVGALALAAGGALAVQKSATAAVAIEDVINACRHPNGGWFSRLLTALGGKWRDVACGLGLRAVQAVRPRMAP